MSETTLKTRYGRVLHGFSPEEETRIEQAAMSDPDSRPLTDEEWERVLPTVRVGLEGRLLRLDADVAAPFYASGSGWQKRINDILREWLKTHEMTA